MTTTLVSSYFHDVLPQPSTFIIQTHQSPISYLNSSTLTQKKDTPTRTPSHALWPRSLTTHAHPNRIMIFVSARSTKISKDSRQASRRSDQCCTTDTLLASAKKTRQQNVNGSWLSVLIRAGPPRTENNGTVDVALNADANGTF